jgi:chemotaxis protein methyltransferase CheR
VKPEDRELVAQLCASRAGLQVDPEKIYFLESRLTPVARREGFASLAEMIQALRVKRDDRLIWAIVESMTVQETSFFRDPESFEVLSEEVLPTVAKQRDGKPIRVWSASCGAGQEIYSIAMTIEEEKGRLGDVAVELFASDLSSRALEKAQSGLYTQFEVQRGLPIRRLVRHFEKNGEMWTPGPQLRQMIRWRRMNLAADFSNIGKFDIIFCRGVLHTLVEAARKRAVEQLALALEPGGFLFVDPQDRLAGFGDALRPTDGRPGLFSVNPTFRRAA